jgi:hypothetical protein
MEEKINIAKILKNKPQGTKLYDLLFNIDVELETISTTESEVWCINETDDNMANHRGYSKFGTLRGCPNGLQILLPSKKCVTGASSHGRRAMYWLAMIATAI